MSRTRLSIVACVLTLSAGCASYHARPLSAAHSAQALEARSLQDPRLRTFIAAAGEPGTAATAGKPLAWDLTTLTLAALYYHPDLDLARARLGIARAGVRAARQIPNPSVTFEDLAYGTTSPAQWTVAPLVDLLIETAGKRKQRTREAQAQVEAARADLLTASWGVRAGVRSALLSLWDAQRRLALLQQRLALQRQLTALLERRLTVGADSAIDVGRERTRVNQASLEVGVTQGEIEAARARLAGAIGIPLHALDGITISVARFDAPPPSPELASGTLQRAALTARSDVQELLAQYAAAEAALALAIADQYPNLTLSPGYSFDSVQDRYVLLPSFELPVLNLHRGSIAVAAARRAEAAARFTALQSQIISAIEGATVEYRAASLEVHSARILLTSETEREQQTAVSFAAGEIDRPTWLTVEIERIAAAQALQAAQRRQREALGALEDALQHPFFGSAPPLRLETLPRERPRS